MLPPANKWALSQKSDKLNEEKICCIRKPWVEFLPLKIHIIVKPTNNVLYISVEPDMNNGGTPLSELSEKKVHFTNILRKIASNRRAVLIFDVAPDSFNTYLLAGWELISRYSYWITIPDIAVNKLSNQPAGPKLD